MMLHVAHQPEQIIASLSCEHMHLHPLSGACFAHSDTDADSDAPVYTFADVSLTLVLCWNLSHCQALLVNNPSSSGTFCTLSLRSSSPWNSVRKSPSSAQHRGRQAQASTSAADGSAPLSPWTGPKASSLRAAIQQKVSILLRSP